MRKSKFDLTRATSQHYWNGYIMAKGKTRLTHISKVRYWKLYDTEEVLTMIQRDMYGAPAIFGNSKGLWVKFTKMPTPKWNEPEFLRGFMDGSTKLYRTKELLLTHNKLLKFWIRGMENLMLDEEFPQGHAVGTHQWRLVLNPRMSIKVLEELYGTPKLGEHWTKIYLPWKKARDAKLPH